MAPVNLLHLSFLIVEYIYFSIINVFQLHKRKNKTRKEKEGRFAWFQSLITYLLNGARQMKLKKWFVN